MSEAHKPWTVRSTRPVLDASPWVRVDKQHVELPDGTDVDGFYRVSLKDYALIYPVTDAGDLLMFRQYKHGVGATCLSFPGGHLEADEEPRTSAERELLEETGFQAGITVGLGSFVVDANQHCATVHLFRADNCHYIRPPKSGDLELMELVRMREEDLFLQHIRDQIRVISHIALAALASGRR